MLTYREMRPEGARISEITADPFDRSTGEEIARALAPLRDRSANDPAGSGHVGLTGPTDSTPTASGATRRPGCPLRSGSTREANR